MPVYSYPSYRLLFCFLLTVACSADPEVSKPLFGDGSNYGSMRVPLQTTHGSHAYALRQATFQLEGTSFATIQSDDTATSPSLQAALPSGDYSLALQDGWQLLQLGPDGEYPLEAILTSPNPQQVVIAPDQVTSIQLEFRINEEQVVLGEGQLEIAFSVDVGEPKSPIFTEFMLNPDALPDNEGEWFEITNFSNREFDLQGCEITRDGAGFVIEAPFLLLPGQVAVFSNGSNPGFAPDYVYSSLTLPNTPNFTISLDCSDQTLDSVTLSSDWAPPAGASLALDPAHETAAGNDQREAWCPSTTSFSEDLGTPGLPNASCGSPEPPAQP